MPSTDRWGRGWNEGWFWPDSPQKLGQVKQAMVGGGYEQLYGFCDARVGIYDKHGYRGEADMFVAKYFCLWLFCTPYSPQFIGWFYGKTGVEAFRLALLRGRRWQALAMYDKQTGARVV
jgi:hypothetical protein